MSDYLAVAITDYFKPARLVPNISSLLKVLVPLVYALAVIVFIIILATGALQFTTAGGDSNMYKAAQDKIKAGVLGIIVIGISYALVKVIGFILNADVPI